MLRGDAANAATVAGEIATYAPGPLRDVVLGSLAMAADDPVTAEGLLTTAWGAATPSEDPEVAGIVDVGGQEDMIVDVAIDLARHKTAAPQEDPVPA